MSWALGPMVGYDCESTGIDVETDRILTACLAVIRPNPAGGKAYTEIRSTVINPGVPVPQAAAEVHGWTTERIQAEGKPPAGELDWIAADLALALSGGIPVVIANAPYDLTILDRELRRHGLPTLDERLDGRPLAPVVDPMVLDRQVDRYRRGKRTLTALCETYDARLDGAHDATFDALAACRVAYRIAQRHPEVGGMDLQALHRAQVGWKATQAASLQDYFRRTKPDEVVDGSWPIRLYSPTPTAEREALV